MKKPSPAPVRARPRGRPAMLDRDRVLEASLELLADEGEQAFSMRRLAAYLGVAPMTLYNHVPDKDNLLSLLVEHMLAGWLPPTPEANEAWPACFAKVCHSLRQHLLQHPAVLTAMLRRDRFALQLFSPMLPLAQALQQQGLAVAAQATILRQACWFTLGFVCVEHRTGQAGTLSVWGNAPDVTIDHALLKELASVNHHELFEQQLQIVITGLQQYHKH